MSVADIQIAPTPEHHEHDDHSLNFWTKYIFSTDHKVIGKQFLIMGIFWAIIGGLLSCAYPATTRYAGIKSGMAGTCPR